MNSINPFLEQVARYYSGHPSLHRLCFVFPNKRSAVFFRHYLRQCMAEKVKCYIEPDVVDVSEFVRRFSPLAEVGRYDAIFTLYRCYTELMPKDTEVSFDRFMFWGEMILNDFNDVDRYMVNPDSLFTNLERLKEIGSNYLTPEQIEIIRRYWGEDAAPEAAEGFWRHMSESGDGAGARFRRLWELLGPLYHKFVEALERKGCTTRGLLYRNAASNAADMALSPGAPLRFVFAGFNVLTTSEIKIFRSLKAIDKADFFWDFDSPAFRNDLNKAGRFIRHNRREFPEPADFKSVRVESWPDIRVIGVPSNVGQTRMASGVIGNWLENKQIKTGEGAINTAVVLPDESLFISMINVIPKGISDMNVTMGFPMKYSPVVSFVSAYRLLQRNARYTDGRVTGYYFDDVNAILTMPVTLSVDAEGAGALSSAILADNLFIVSPEYIREKAPLLAPLMTPMPRKISMDSAARIISEILDHISSRVTDKFTLFFIKAYKDAVAEICAAAMEKEVEMESATFLSLLNRAVRGGSVNFEGEPLKGLQIMGMLETRALDFENVVVLSMNERVFPRKNYSRSFIPDILRRGFGMATTDFQESIFAYYFYRLISRAKNVTLIYDSRSVGGTRSSEMSRYITQLLYLFPDAKTHLLAASLPQRIFTQSEPVIAKTPEVMDKLLNFTREDTGWCLSASAINTYLNCPLQFYLKYAEGFDSDTEITDYIDSSTFGTIVHEVFQNLYSGLSDSGCNGIVTPEFLEIVSRESHPLVPALIHESINRHFHKIHNPSRYKPLLGETKVIATLVENLVKSTLKAEIETAPFEFVGAEMRVSHRLQVNDSLTVNIKQMIDRVDRIGCPSEPDGTLLRIVDYKTGQDKTTATDVVGLLNPKNPTRNKAIMQVLFYCYVYAEKFGYTGPIKPVVYSLPKVLVNGLPDLKIGKTPLEDYRPCMAEYIPALKGVLEEIFNPDVPFTIAADKNKCHFCGFKSICGRENADEF